VCKGVQCFVAVTSPQLSDRDSSTCDGMIMIDARILKHVAKPEMPPQRSPTFRRSEQLSSFFISLGLNLKSLPGMAEPEAAVSTEELDLQYVQYEPAKEEQHLPAIRQLISKDLSEPYSIYVYRYFLYQWGDLCYMVPLLLFILVPMLFLHISKPC
jgi:hypothetical protein